ncbi:TIGR03618 family F420-dependent PPOX class oxidoreductase [Actinoplanes sp. NEAU-A12]|uniref:TIGR03618 family F420-dependent PPOX class oxidoreductase n=1 Tax=Actinoplanes sandaracinus TaxID=3045177 RepID=A0ABT6WL07_9ACTN|nr:TIGR03618 family F420-dependent PPOX class oxidoreductase [Actinoplanes sandaracinus]MDI6100405.1 TIGR03618 family F420-dependent PPOX class oxidoreductase [Actinoplanes sandaracinus]
MSETHYGPGQGPSARALTDDEVIRILGSQQFGVLATVKRNGHPHLASMVFTWDADERLLRFSSAAGRIKVSHLRRDPRATLHVQGGNVFSYAVAEGEAQVSEPSVEPGDATGRELLAMVGGLGDAADETAFLEQMVKDRRVVISLRVSRLYGTALDGPVES